MLVRAAAETFGKPFPSAPPGKDCLQANAELLRKTVFVFVKYNIAQNNYFVKYLKAESPIFVSPPRLVAKLGQDLKMPHSGDWQLNRSENLWMKVVSAPDWDENSPLVRAMTYFSEDEEVWVTIASIEYQTRTETYWYRGEDADDFEEAKEIAEQAAYDVENQDEGGLEYLGGVNGAPREYWGTPLNELFFD